MSRTEGAPADAMGASVFMFCVARDESVTALLRGVEQAARLEVDAPVRAVRSWLDTFDWRLHAAGVRLEQVVCRGQVRVSLGTGADVAAEFMLDEAPRFAADLPPGVLRRRLAPLLSVRALLPRVSAPGTLQAARVLDARSKTVVRVELWRPPRRGDALLRVLAVRGFEDQAARVAAALARGPRTRSLDTDPLADAAAKLEVPPGRYPSWKPGPLDPRARADDTVQTVLRHYAGVMAINLQGMREDIDSEFLHDFRVGLRRSRALVRRVPGLFVESRLAPFRDDLAWLGQITGPPRDADVHVLVFPEYARALDPAQAAALGPFTDRVRRAQVEAHRALLAALDSARFRRRWPAWQRFLERPPPRASRQPAGPRPVAEVAAEAVLKAQRRVRRHGRRITSESPPTAYHDLRKCCKNLRYLIDAFGSLWVSKHFSKATRRLKDLQDVLGEHQDLDVHRAAIRAMHRELVEAGEMPPDTHDAMTAMMREMETREVAARGRFAERFRRLLELPLDKAVQKALRGSAR